jgi:hypothetical protein
MIRRILAPTVTREIGAILGTLIMLAFGYGFVLYVLNWAL